MTSTQEMRVAGRYIPKDSIEVQGELGVVYVYRTGRRYAAIAYKGTAKHASFHYGYPDMDSVDQAICNFFGSLAERSERMATYRADSYKPHTFKAGDIVTNSWGYDQTNVDWYRVVRTTASFVWLQPICGHTEETGFMSGRSLPAVDVDGSNPNAWKFMDKGEVTKHKATGSNVSMKYGSGSKWDGREKYESWYA